jgi:hypothetical protein
VGGMIKRKGLKKYPYYSFFLWGLWAKIIGGLLFGMIYLFYYGSGDTNSYYECGIAFYRLLYHDPLNFLQAYFGPGTLEIKSLFDSTSGQPLWYIFSDDKTRFVVKLIVPLMAISGGSYFITTVLISIITYGGLWKLYEVFCHNFKPYYRILAVGILFMPSVIFWGSGIMKDSFTMAATCYFIVFTDRIINSKGSVLFNILMLMFSAFLIVSIKPYILIILLPGTLVWFFYDRVMHIRNLLLRILFIPFIYAVVFGGSFLILRSLDEKLGKFSLENALDTAAIIQHDLKQSYYQGNSFDIGDLDPTPIGVISKFPQATLAGLFRPFIWESENIVMFISGFENLLVLLLTLIVIIRTKFSTWKFLLTHKPIVLYSFIFSILFAFMVGLTTSNFGTLVRYRIPLIPLYMSSILILYAHIRSIRITNKRQKLTW